MADSIRTFFSENCVEDETSNGLLWVNENVSWYLTLGNRQGANTTYLAVKAPNATKYTLIGSIKKILDNGQLYAIEKNWVFVRVRDNIAGSQTDRDIALNTLQFELAKVAGVSLKNTLNRTFGSGSFYTKSKKKQDESYGQLATYVAGQASNQEAVPPSNQGTFLLLSCLWLGFFSEKYFTI